MFVLKVFHYRIVQEQLLPPAPQRKLYIDAHIRNRPLRHTPCWKTEQ